MKTFHDSQKMAWMIDLNFGTMQRLKALGWNLLDLEAKRQTDSGNEATVQEILETDPLSVFEVLWLIVEPQAKELQISAEEFGQRMAADCLANAQDALLGEIVDFFQSLRRYDVAKAVEKSLQIRQMAARKIKAKLAKVDEMDGEIEKRIDGALNESFSTLQGELASILGGTPGDSSPG